MRLPCTGCAQATAGGVDARSARLLSAVECVDTAPVGGSDTCQWANDGFCDAAWSCSEGTDCTDCVEYSCGATDAQGKSCSFYASRFARCSRFDDTDFSADMCCDCGGGLWLHDCPNSTWPVGVEFCQVLEEPAPHGSTCTAVECKANYTIDTAASMQAELVCHGGIWEGHSVCLAPCLDMPAGRVCLNAGVALHGDICEFECDAGYVAGELKCVDGMWDGPGECLSPCFDMPLGTGCSNPDEVIRHGESCEVECDASYTKAGDLVCVNGVFEGTGCLPPCIEMPVELACSNSEVVRHGDACEFECAPGFTKVGDLICESGRWAGSYDCLAPCIDMPSGMACLNTGVVRHGEYCDAEECDLHHTMDKVLSLIHI